MTHRCVPVTASSKSRTSSSLALAYHVGEVSSSHTPRHQYIYMIKENRDDSIHGLAFSVYTSYMDGHVYHTVHNIGVF